MCALVTGPNTPVTNVPGNRVAKSTLIKFGSNRSLDDPTVAMQHIIDQAMDLVASADALTGQDVAARPAMRGC